MCTAACTLGSGINTAKVCGLYTDQFPAAPESVLSLVAKYSADPPARKEWIDKRSVETEKKGEQLVTCPEISPHLMF